MAATLVKNYESTITDDRHPYLTGAWAPITEEYNATDMEVIGEIPDDIDGIYIRNTENPVHEALGRYHPFNGDGMLHMMAFKDGKAEYRNRFIRTRGFEAEQEAGESLWAGWIAYPVQSKRPGECASQQGLKDASSTDVVVHAGKILTTFFMCGEGYRLDPYTLDHLGIEAWTPIDGISAHPKVDEATGEMMFFNYTEHAPFMHYGVVDAKNKLQHYIPINVNGPCMPHDMAFSKNYSILNELPMAWIPEMLEQGIYMPRYDEEKPSRFAVVPRYGQPEDIKWFEGKPTYVLHWLNAYEDGDELIMDGYFQGNPMPDPLKDHPRRYSTLMALLDLHSLEARLHRWRFNLKTGETIEEDLDDEVLEFGMFNQKYAGEKYRYVYSAKPKKEWFLFEGLVKHDLETGEKQTLMFGENRFGSEAPFVPRINAKGEDDGYLVSFITDMNTDTSECVLIDARDIEAGPVCRIMLPHRIPSGTHATWANGEDIRVANAS
ncbi:carotenoid oxygenase family protein [Kordiimonas sp. SCSIO 12610]|uniref:carotenoid oxygenase family protein n=1 Tax=Kordiimonas sp. SCSIO 12610 TaxID=2829597 RepID=UPI00210C794E|nr:carotenoid oxygenase family protein [Kordiimonas sp. SCSIO 12610]UTW53988.1 carotenoid oxygenase family protein [Kordiimonas sp. SCSIO 12610]